MKKAKIIFSALALFAVVGGALAFKAQKYGTTIFTGTNGACTVPLANATITTTFDEDDVRVFASTTRTLVCGLTYTTVNQ